GDSPAAGRLKVGDVIQEINRKRINRASEVDAALARSEKGAMLVVERDGTQTLVSLPAPDDDTEK
ncbi:MAG: serine peptidase, partial [Oligoflexia bacterium]|nr:serine peptidase [Oligoflexia bacterium]